MPRVNSFALHRVKGSLLRHRPGLTIGRSSLWTREYRCTKRVVMVCVVNAAVQVMFTQFQYSSSPVLPPSHLRQALARSFADQQRYQLGRMDDAAECFVRTRSMARIATTARSDKCELLLYAWVDV